MKKSEKTRLFILEQAVPIFNKKGIAGTTIDDVLAATKLAKGGLYSHFENKAELAKATVDYLFSKYAITLGTVIANATTAKGKLVALMDMYSDPLSPLIDGGCPILNLGVESDDTNPAIQQQVKAVIERLLKRISGIIRQGIADREFSEDFDADEFAVKMLTMIEGGMLIGRVLGSNKEMHRMIQLLKNEIESYELT